jgi:hypothetical protein
MPSTDAPTWWADVQQEREDLAGPSHRPADDWLGEEIDFVPRRRLTSAPADASVQRRSSVTAQAERDHHELVHLSAADDPFATPPPPAGSRRTIQIKGRPADALMSSMAQRHRGRTASDRIGHRPDRIALWAVALGAVLILLAAMTSSSQAAVAHRAATAPAVSAKVVHVAHHAPVRTFHLHR